MSTAAARSSIVNRQSAIPTGWMPAGEAARVKGLTERTVRRLCAAGRLDAVRGADGRWHVNPNCDPALKMAAGLFCPKSPSGPAETPPLALAGSPLAGLSAAKRAAMARKYRVVEAYLAAREHKPADVGAVVWQRRFVETWNAVHPDERTSRPTLLRHVKAFRKNGISGLVDKRDYHGPASISPEALEFILGLYCRQEKHHLAAIYERAEAIAPVEGWQLPSLRTVQRIVAERVDPRLVALGREPKRYRDRYLPTALRDWSQVPAMHLWVADHRLLDIWVPRRWYDTKTRRERVTFQRPWLTLFMDGRSWLPVAWQIAFDAPNAQRVAQTFIKGISEHGCPEVLYLDNGKDFRAGAFAGGRPRKGKRKIFRTQRVGPLLEMLGIGVKWALPYNARAKVVEPYFKIVAERFDKCWDTYCGPSPEDRPERLKGMKAEDWESKLSLTDVQAAFDAWIIDDYALRESPAAACKGLAAIEAFRTLRAEGFVKRTPPAEDLALLLLPSRRQKVGPNGIFVRPFMAHYDCPEFEPLRCSRQRVTYRYNEHDRSVVYVFDAETDRFIAAASVYAGERLDPLAEPASPDAERLADVLAARNRQAKRDRNEVKRLKALASNALLASQRDAAAKIGLHLAEPGAGSHDDEPTAIPLVAGGELSKAAAAGRKRRRMDEQTRAARKDAAALRRTGTDAEDTRPRGVSVRETLRAARESGRGQESCD